MRVQDVLSRFPNYKRSGKWYLVNCPCHRDITASLSLCDTTYTTKDGKTSETIAVKCFAGCSAKAIKTWLKTEKSTFYQHKKSEKIKEKRKIVKVYPYTKNGKLIYEVIRFEPKHFSQRRKASDGRYVWGITAGYYYLKYNSWVKCVEHEDNYEQVTYFPEVETLLYNLDNVIVGLKKNPSARVFIVGGEKDVDTLTKHKFLALSNSGGEGADKWKSAFSVALTDLNVVFIPDNDLTGYEHLYRVAESVIPKCASFKVIELPGLKKEHEDTFDWFTSYQGSAEWLKKLVLAVEDYKHKPEAIRTDFQFRLNSEKEPEQSDFIEALQAEADEISQFRNLSSIGLCEDCKGTEYSFKTVDGYTLFFAEKVEKFIKPVPCLCSVPQSADDFGF